MIDINLQISVIIPTYNCLSELKILLNKLLFQTVLPQHRNPAHGRWDFLVYY